MQGAGNDKGLRGCRLIFDISKFFVTMMVVLITVSAIGTMASHGCIRMYNRDVLELWPQVPIGTYVVTTK